VRSYLQSTYKYTIDLQHDPSKEPLAEFLFERKQGHCEYFASAMAMLMRAAGVPARHVAGFYGGEWNEVGHYLQIRQRDAHAWVEVWLGPLGWMPFDPTPAAPGQGEASSVTSRLRQMLDVVQLAWFKYVIEYDLTTQMDLFMKFRRAASDWKFWKSEKKDGAPSEPFWTAAHARAAGAVTMLAGLALLLWKWRRPRGKGSRTPRAARATAALRRAERALEKRGIPRGDSDTPRQVAARAVEQNDPGAEPFEELVEAYYEARFGPGAVDAEQVDRIARLADLVVKPPIPAAPPTAAPRSPTGPTI
jgi:hypothetical protein